MNKCNEHGVDTHKCDQENVTDSTKWVINDNG